MVRFFVLFSAVLLGIGLGAYFFTPRHVWDYEEKEFMDLDRIMSKDKSERLALVAITQEGAYKLTKFDTNAYELQWRLVKK